MTRAWWWTILIVMSVTVIALDVATGPFISFPILFTIPVGLAAWFISRTAGLAFAGLLVSSRFALAVHVESLGLPIWADLINTLIRLLVLGALAVLLEKVRRQRDELAHRVEALEGILPICMFCKRIRGSDGAWEQVDSYISHRSAAQFSHSFCDSCGREHYGEYV